jgi:two-component system, NarL family, nitrate/nitrite response regulator NarL
MAEIIRILIVDDHVVVREGLRLLIETQPDMEVAGEAANSVDAMAIAFSEKPDIIVLDLDLGGESGLSLISGLIAPSKKTRVLILTGIQDAEVHHRAIRLGAVGIVHKSEASKTLIKAIRKVHSGEVWIDRHMTASVLAEITRPAEAKKDDPEISKMATLTEREREVISLIGESLRTKDIAGRLFISEKTVRNHMASIYSKLGVTDRFDLVVYAYKHGLASPPH